MGLSLATRPLFRLVWPVLLVALIQAGVTALSLDLLSTVRAYTTGQAFWTKGQKDAVYFLDLYASTGDNTHLARFTEAIGIPLADRDARRAMEGSPIDLDAARRGLLGGGNHPDDIRGIITLFRYFRWYPHVAEAVRHWRATDPFLDDLLVISREIKSARLWGGVTPELIERHRQQIFAVNKDLTPLAVAFSQSLGVGARAVTQVLMAGNGAIALLLVLLAARRLNRILVQRQQVEDELRREKEKAQVTLASLGEAVIRTDRVGLIEYLNGEAERLIGWPAAEAIGRPIRRVLRFIDPETGSASALAAGDAQGAGPVLATIRKLVRRDGSMVLVSAVNAPLAAGKTPSGAVLILHDRSNEDAYVARLAWQASHDELTGLSNRRALEQALGDVLTGPGAEGDQHALMFLDLDQFKIVNDTCGHAAGDQLLRQLTAELKDRLRTGDLLARLGGDEFAVLIGTRSFAAAADIAERLRRAVEELHFTCGEATFRIGASIGLVHLDQPGLTVEEALKAADVACYMAKERGRNCVQIYQPENFQLQETLGEMASVQRIQKGLSDNRFRLHAQDICSLPIGKGSVRGVELLLRLEGEAGELVPPCSFIPAAERYGLMPMIDRWVVSHGLDIVGRWIGQGGPVPAFFTINLSGASFRQGGFVDHVRAELRRTGVDPRRICFEITETVAIKDIASAQTFMGEMKDCGCRFALDDFGAGMSSFAYLKTLPVDFLKIDGQFIRHICTEPTDRAIVEAIVAMARALGKQTIAEKVEDAATVGLLQSLGIDWVQGFGIGRPQPIPLIAVEAAPLQPDGEPSLPALGETGREVLAAAGG